MLLLLSRGARSGISSGTQRPAFSSSQGNDAMKGLLSFLIVFAVLFLTLGRRDSTKLSQKSPALILLAAAGAGLAFLLLHHLHHF